MAAGFSSSQIGPSPATPRGPPASPTTSGTPTVRQTAPGATRNTWTPSSTMPTATSGRPRSPPTAICTSAAISRPAGRAIRTSGCLDSWTVSISRVENLGDSINTAGGEIEPWIAPDESYLIFSGARRADSVGTYDLYIAERRASVWQRAHLLPNGIDTKYFEFNPSVTPEDRKSVV